MKPGAIFNTVTQRITFFNVAGDNFLNVGSIIQGGNFLRLGQRDGVATSRDESGNDRLAVRVRTIKRRSRPVVKF